MGKIHCDICKKKCKGDVLKIDKKFLHKDCFNCCKCNRNLDKCGFFQKDNTYYCTEDYNKQFGVKCGICNKFADGEVITVLGRTFHIECFKCHNCSHPFLRGEKATLWGDHYLCDRCACEKQEKENVSPSIPNHKSVADSDFIIPRIETPSLNAVETNCAVEAPFTDSSDTEGAMQPQDFLQPHLNNGFTSTDSEVKEAKSEFGYLSPCYSTSSGDESWMRSVKMRQNKAQNYFHFGKCLNQSYLNIEKRMSDRTPANARYRAMVSSTSPHIKSAHFHRPVSPLTPNFADTRFVNTPRSVSMRLNTNSHQDSQGDLNLTEEVKRLAHFPDGREPDSTYDLPIDRLDFPAPTFLNRASRDFRKDSRGIIVSSTGNISAYALSCTDSTLPSTDLNESEDERVRKYKVEKRIKILKSTGKYVGDSQSRLDQVEMRVTSKREDAMDPVSSSRSPDASFEPVNKTRYDRHTFTSPSRDSRYEGRHAHELQSRMHYTSTGGRTGAMSGYTSCLENDSIRQSSQRSINQAPQHRFAQGFMSCGEVPLQGRAASSLSGRTSSLPRPFNMYIPQAAVPHSVYMLDSHMTPSMTTSGYSVDATTHSVDESTINGGSRILTLQGHRNGYMSDMAPSSAITDVKRTRQGWLYESDNNEAVLHSNYPTVQSYLKQSYALRSKEKIPAQVIPYEKLKISNFSLPKGLDRSKLEIYLSDTDFNLVFHMSRQAFNRLPEWKRNDLKRKMDLY